MDQVKNSSPGRRCDVCGRNLAEVKVTEVDKDGKAAEHMLCSDCAQNRGILASSKTKLSAAEVIKELRTRQSAEDNQMVCPRCRMTYADFKRTLRVGCEHCYEAFAEHLGVMLKRVHGATGHTGRAPKPGPDAAGEFERRRLQRELRRAVAAEDYERAAAVRDRMRQNGGEPPKD